MARVGWGELANANIPRMLPPMRHRRTIVVGAASFFTVNVAE
jgi:hypothetical protein